MKEKAKELVNKFYFNDKLQISYEEAILCALICTDEKINLLLKLNNLLPFAPSIIVKKIKDLREVKQEINNL